MTSPSAHAAARTMSAVDLLVLGFEALSDDEQAEALTRLGERHLARQAGTESETARFLSSLLQVAELVGGPPTPDDYKTARDQLRERGIEIESLSRVIRHFGTWRRAKEALQLAETNTARRIDARFRFRRLGKIWRYTDETLRDTLARAVAEIGHVPQVAEFDHWRQRELELAQAEGNDALHLPSANPYRKRWGSWAEALRHFGYTQAEIDGRLEQL